MHEPTSRNIPVNYTDGQNTSPVEEYISSICKSMQNIQKITNTGGCNKYTIKYCGKIKEQNYVILYANTNKIAD